MLLSLDEKAEMLSDFGLTHNQAKVYMTIAQLGLATVSQASKASKVRREDVYRILPKLEKTGLIERILGKPTKIRALPMEEALHVLIEREQEIANKRVSALMTKKDTILKHYKPSTMKTNDEAHFALILHREGIMGKELSMVKKAKSAINIVTSRDKFLQFFNNYDEALKKATNKGMQVRMILNVTEHDESILRTIKEYESARVPIDLKYTDQRSTHCMIVDYKEALVSTSSEPTLRETPYLWTDDSSLVGLLQKNFEGLWHASVALRTIETEAVAEKLIHVLQDLRPTNHAIVLYESLEAKYNVLFNYVKLGLENGEAVAYVCSESPSQIRDAMKRLGIDVEKYEKTGALRILEWNDFYIIDGKFDATTTIGLINKLYNEALTKGFKRYRIIGEMECFFEHKLVKELVEYERALHRVFNIPVIALCTYNSNMVMEASNPMDLYNELLKAHGTVLFSGLSKELGKIEIRKA
ncbi:MAG: MEDS domain-containing protein [Candidatus Bathyarchaeota archaeon]|nr:MEDS domain-containing protein [Candidatus Bathyarchaeota archaeon]